MRTWRGRNITEKRDDGIAKARWATTLKSQILDEMMQENQFND